MRKEQKEDIFITHSNCIIFPSHDVFTLNKPKQEKKNMRKGSNFNKEKFQEKKNQTKWRKKENKNFGEIDKNSCPLSIIYKTLNSLLISFNNNETKE